MKVQVWFLSLLFFAASLASAQKNYCSKYKKASRQNRLLVQDHRGDSIDVLHTMIDFTVPNVTVNEVSGFAEIKYQVKLSDVNKVRFDFEGLTVDSILGNNVSSFIHSHSILTVNFSQALNINVIDSLTVYYHGSPIKDRTGWGGFYFSDGFAWNLGVGFGADPHSYGRVWFPCFDNFLERSSYEFKITTQRDKKATCNGALISEITNSDSSKTYHWKLDQHIPSYLVCVAIGSYEVITDVVTGDYGPVPIELFARATDTNNLKASFSNLGNAILKFESSFGEYRFDKVGYSLVPFNAGAMEHAANITYPIYAANGSFDNESLMAHELGHMWWGDNVTCLTDGDMWINEGWASFSAYLFQEEVYGREAYEFAMAEDLRFMLQFGHHLEGSYRAVSGQPHDLVYGDHVYKKGALVAHNLRGYMGDDLFFQTIESFMEKYKYSAVSSDTLEKYFSNESGIDLVPFFRDWIFSGGYNVVVMDSFNSMTNGSQFDLNIFLQQKLKGRADYHDNVPIYYELKDNSGNSQFGNGELSGKYGELQITSSFQPDFILIYPKNEQAQARTRDTIHPVASSDYNLKNMLWKVNVVEVNGAAEIVFDHIWSAPDPVKNWLEQPIRLSTYHYWKIHGLNVESIDMTAEFYYNGKINSNNSGYLDMDLLSETEDSLKLYYRPSTSSDWEEYDDYTKDDFGITTDSFGLIKLSSVKPGEYALGNIDHSTLSTSKNMLESIRIYPNPAKDTLVISQSLFESVTIKIVDMSGKEVMNTTTRNGEQSIAINELNAGQYLIQILEGQNLLVNQKFTKH